MEGDRGERWEAGVEGPMRLWRSKEDRASSPPGTLCTECPHPKSLASYDFVPLVFWMTFGHDSLSHPSL